MSLVTKLKNNIIGALALTACDVDYSVRPLPSYPEPPQYGQVVLPTSETPRPGSFSGLAFAISNLYAGKNFPGALGYDPTFDYAADGLYLKNLATGQVRSLLKSKQNGYVGQIIDQSIRPDGKQIAIAYDPKRFDLTTQDYLDNTPETLFILNEDGTKEPIPIDPKYTSFAFHANDNGKDYPTECCALQWSPDGKMLAITVDERDQQFGYHSSVLLYDPQQKEFVKELPINLFETGAGTVVWNPNGREFVVELSPTTNHPTGNWMDSDLYRLNVETGTLEGIATTQGVSEESPAFSSDGTFAYLSRAVDPQKHLSQITYDPNPQIVLQSHGVTQTLSAADTHLYFVYPQFHFSPDGSELGFIATPGLDDFTWVEGVYTINTDGTDLQKRSDSTIEGRVWGFDWK